MLCLREIEGIRKMGANRIVQRGRLSTEILGSSRVDFSLLYIFLDEIMI